MYVFVAALVIMAKRWTRPKCQSMDERTSKMWSLHTVDSFSATRRNEALIRATAWINLESIAREGSQSQKTTYYRIPFI